MRYTSTINGILTLKHTSITIDLYIDTGLYCYNNAENNEKQATD